MPAALVPLMKLPEISPLTCVCVGWWDRPIAPCMIWNSFSPPVSIGSVQPTGSFRPMFSNVL